LADIALFRLHEGAFPLYDNAGVMRTGQQLLRNVEMIVGGRVLERRRRRRAPCGAADACS
jgi:predicted amidohydrolase